MGEEEGEEEVPIKLQDYKIGPLITIYGELKEKLENQQENKVCNNYFEWKYKKCKRSNSAWAN